MHPIDIQNAIDRVQAGERLLHVRKAEEGDDDEEFSRRLNQEVEIKKTSVTDAEHAEGTKVEEEGSGKNPFARHRKKREAKDGKEPSEEDSKIKEEGKGNILDLNA